MQEQEYIKNITGFKESSIKNVVGLLSEGATVPFIARYRKELSGGLDEVEIAFIRDEVKKFNDLIARQNTILSAIEEQNQLTGELKSKILDCFDPVLLEDIYLPYKQKRLTRGEKAKKLGLEPLAKMIMSQRGGDPFQMAERYVKGEVFDEDQAIEGAKDIIAEWMNENVTCRGRLRETFEKRSVLTSKLVKGKEVEAEKYKDYFDHSENLSRVASHRFLALYRANREGFLSLKARPDEESVLQFMERFFVKGNDACSNLVSEAAHDSYKRLLRPSLENEALSKTKEKADAEAIKVFGKNLRQLLLAPTFRFETSFGT